MGRLRSLITIRQQVITWANVGAGYGFVPSDWQEDKTEGCRSWQHFVGRLCHIYSLCENIIVMLIHVCAKDPQVGRLEELKHINLNLSMSSM